MEKCEFMDRVVETITYSEQSVRDSAVLMASWVVLSVVEQACDVMDTMRMHVAECKTTALRSCSSIC